MSTVEVVYENVQGWHRFTSPQVYGLYILVGPDQYWDGREDLPAAIGDLLASNYHRNVSVRSLDKPNGVKPKVLHFAIES